MERKCITCYKTKPLEAFIKVRGKGHGQRCDICRVNVNATTRQFFMDAGYEHDPTQRVLSVYKLTEAEYKALKDRHGGRCAICGDERPLVVDHCHNTGIVRGLLCNPCNTGIGLMRDCPDRLASAIQYLSK